MDQLSVNLADATKAFTEQLATQQPNQPESAPTGINPDPIQPIESDIEVPESPFWSSEEEIVPGLKVKPEPKEVAEKPKQQESKVPNILEVKANGKELKLDLTNPEHLEKIKADIAAAEGVKKAFTQADKANQRIKQLEAELQAAQQYKQSWDKLEQLRHDKAKMIELITGESYNDFVQREVQRQHVMQYGTEEEKALFQAADRARALEEKLQAMERESARREQEAKEAAERAERAKEEAQNEQFKTQLHKSFLDHVDSALPDDLKQMVYQKTVLDLKKLYKEYGRVTNKMIEKTMADNAKRIKSFSEQTVQSELTKAVENKKQTATAQAQAASTKNYEPDVEGINLASLTPDKLFQAMRFMNRKSK